MKIKEITIKNFFRYGPNEQTLKLGNANITGILGNNGNGKTTLIVDSLSFALYGKYRTPTADEVVNYYIGKDCKVGVEFTIDNDVYKVIRYRKHSTHGNSVYLFKNDVDISGHTIPETNNKIQDVIKIPYIGFTNSSVFSSELYSAFLSKSLTERVVVFENILSLKEINLIYTTIGKIIKEVESSKIDVDKEKTNIEAEIAAINSASNNYLISAKQKLLEMKQNKENALSKIKEIDEKLKELKLINIDEEKKKINNLPLKNEYLSRIKQIEKEEENLVEIIPKEEVALLNNYANVDFDKEYQKEQLYEENLETLKARKDGMEAKNKEIQGYKKDLKSFDDTINLNLGKLEVLSNQILKLNSNKCPCCGQTVNADFVAAEKEKAENEINNIKQENEELEKATNDTKVKLEEAKNDYEWLLSNSKQIEEKLDKNFLRNALVIREKFINAQKHVNEINELNAKNAQKREEYKILKEELTDKLSKLEISIYTENEIKSISSKIEVLNNKKIEYEKEISSIEASKESVFNASYVEGLKKQIADKSVELDKVNVKFEQCNKDLKYYNYLYTKFSNKSSGFKKYFIGQMIDLFNTKVKQYLPFFFTTEDVSIEFDKNLDCKITMDENKVDFTAFSQGQRQKAELAINFALFDVARIYFSNDNDLLVLDEMDKGLDYQGIKAMVNILKGFKDLKIFIVSHNPLFEDELQNKITIKRDENNFSVISK